MDKHIPVRRAKPAVASHIEAVKAALHDGRLRRETFAESAGVGLRVVELWMVDAPIQESYHARLWGAAVTSTIPGWPTPRAATDLD